MHTQHAWRSWHPPTTTHHLHMHLHPHHPTTQRAAHGAGANVLERNSCSVERGNTYNMDTVWNIRGTWLAVTRFMCFVRCLRCVVCVREDAVESVRGYHHGWRGRRHWPHEQCQHDLRHVSWWRSTHFHQEEDKLIIMRSISWWIDDLGIVIDWILLLYCR